MPTLAVRLATIFVLLLSLLPAYQSNSPASHLTDPFAAGWMLVDTNGDGIIDYVAGKVVVPARPTAVENAAAADIAARIGFATTGLTPPIVISSTDDRADGPRIYIGRDAAPAKYRADIEDSSKSFEDKEGGVFDIGGNLIVLGHDDEGLLAAAELFASRAPYVSKIGGDKLATLRSAGDNLRGITYTKGMSGVQRVFLDGAINRLPASAPLPSAVPSPTAPDAATTDAEGAGPARLDLATLYTMRGLFRGTPRMPIPSNLDSSTLRARRSRWNRDGKPRRAHGT